MLQERFLALLFVFWGSTVYLSINNIAAEAQPHRVYNVMSFGATGNGQTDDSQGFLKAWKATCKDRGDKGTPVMYVPRGKKFLLSPTCFRGPCNSNSVHVQVLGYIVAPHSRSGWKHCTIDSWLAFINVAGLTVQGSGTIDGQGSIWWNGGQVHKQPGTCHWPTALYFENCDKLVLTGLHHKDSPRAHIAINECNHVKLSSLTITAPKSSPNTDGVDIAHSRYVTLQHLNIGTGDDCVAVNGNSAFINITGVFCGPGHGISVGSLGRYHTDVVEEVHVRNCTFTNTICGARIKTWPNGLGHARKISFEDITLNAAGSPIIIDQRYGGPQNTGASVGVAVRDVTYKGFRGTSSTNAAIELICGKTRGCSGIKMDNVHIKSSSPGKKVVSFCKNASGRATNTSPRVPCLRG